MTDNLKIEIVDDKPLVRKVKNLTYRSFQRVKDNVFQPFYILNQPFPNKTVLNKVIDEEKKLNPSLMESPSISPSLPFLGSGSPSPSASLSPIEVLSETAKGSGSLLSYVNDTYYNQEVSGGWIPNNPPPTSMLSWGWYKKFAQSFTYDTLLKVNSFGIYNDSTGSLLWPDNEYIMLTICGDDGFGFPDEFPIFSRQYTKTDFLNAGSPSIISVDTSLEDIYFEPLTVYYVTFQWSDGGSRSFWMNECGIQNSSFGPVTGHAHVYSWYLDQWEQDESRVCSVNLSGQFYG